MDGAEREVDLSRMAERRAHHKSTNKDSLESSPIFTSDRAKLKKFKNFHTSSCAPHLGRWSKCMCAGTTNTFYSKHRSCYPTINYHTITILFSLQNITS